MSPHTRTESRTENLLTWEVALDRLELDVIMSRRLLRVLDPPHPEPWDVPDVTGPIPASLLPRALDIQRRQAAVQLALREALTANGKHRALTDRVNRASSQGLINPVYVDLTA